MKILIICNNISLPYVKMSGVSVVYKLIQQLQGTPSFDLTVLSSRGKDTVALSDVHYVRSSNLVIARVCLFFKALFLLATSKYDLAIDFNSLPVFCIFLSVYRQVFRIKVLSVHLTINENFFGRFFPKWLLSLVNTFVFTDLTTYKKFGSTKNSVFCPIAFGFDDMLNLPLPAPSNKHLLFLGSLEKRKGSSVLLKAIPLVSNQFKDTQLVVASFGKEIRDRNFDFSKKNVLEISHKLNINIIFLEGWIGVPDFFQRGSIFVFPSTSRHGTLGQPLTLLEAMAAGLVCVVSDIYRQESFLVEKENCIFFKSEDPADLARAITEIFNDLSLFSKLSSNARGKILNKYSSNQILNSWLSIISS